MKITNNHGESLGLPTGQVVAPGDTVTIAEDDIPAITGNDVLKAWDDKKIITIEGAPKAGGTGSQTGGSTGGDDERTVLMARLDELKVSYDKRTGVAKLRELVTEAEKKAAEADSNTGDGAGTGSQTGGGEG
ncbi:hypothetical protein [Luteimonas fraxinea]|uniref:Uncharacterized protein n=1 Tax=Luteimonas fraxinea TaxID=2901869 RepID=A0ABS8UCG5_9GAMM|nr:hypothetical protein [Luteimonas fraxinea]MCD9096190.1 hypothetical protein [Luteimonas fraxinea]